jgi:hypothetical protein
VTHITVLNVGLYFEFKERIMVDMNEATQDHQSLELEITRLRNLLAEVRTLCNNQVMFSACEKADDPDTFNRDWGQDMMAEKVLDLLDQAGA